MPGEFNFIPDALSRRGKAPPKSRREGHPDPVSASALAVVLEHAPSFDGELEGDDLSYEDDVIPFDWPETPISAAVWPDGDLI